MINIAEVKISENGVINLPGEMCLPYDTVTIKVRNDAYPKYINQFGKCMFCGNDSNLHESNGISICKICYEAYMNDEFISYYDFSEEITLRYDREIELSEKFMFKAGLESEEVVLLIYNSLENEIRIIKNAKKILMQNFDNTKNYYNVLNCFVTFETLKNINMAWE